MKRIVGLVVASAGFGSAVTIALTKPPVVVAVLMKIGLLFH